MEQNKKHTIQIEYGQGFISTAIDDVLAFNEKQIILKLSSGDKVQVSGDNLKLSGFNKQLGELRVSGSVVAVKYIFSVKQKLKKFFG